MSEASIFNHLIPYSQAGSYLNNIKDSKLLELCKTHLGGTLSVSHFHTWEKEPDFSGIMIWFCLDSSSKLFLAFEGKSGFKYPSEDPAQAGRIKPVSKKLIKCNLNFGHDLERESDREQFLRKHVAEAVSSEEYASNAEVEEGSKKFLSNPVFSQFEKYGFAYFGNDEGHITTFLGQPGIEFIRLYLGFDPSLPINNIRIIMVPVGKEGNNLEFDDQRSEYQLLEKSVPPPPVY
jgi:hypothetical protein